MSPPFMSPPFGGAPYGRSVPGTAHVAIGIALLIALGVAALTALRVQLRLSVVTAAVRATAQLAVIGVVIRFAFRHPGAAAAVVAVMYVVAVITAGRRTRELGRSLPAIAAAIVSGVAPVLGIAMAVPVVPRTTRYLIALTGIVIGNAMVACTLSGRAFARGLRSQRDEVEGWLAIGATMRQACAPIARTAIAESLLPALDQTRTVGLVTLPGAFVGTLAGGASPAGAARFQLIVLVGIVVAQILAAGTLMQLRGAPATLPADPDPPRTRHRTYCVRPLGRQSRRARHVSSSRSTALSRRRPQLLVPGPLLCARRARCWWR
jgi:putative ABC transport system permease protein